MILLTSTSDKIQVITSAAGSIDLHASYVDNSASTVTPDRLNISGVITATTTNLVASPGASTYRSVKFISVYNNSLTVTNTITIDHTDGTNVATLWKGNLGPGEGVKYDNGFQKYSSAGAISSSVTAYPVDTQDFATAGTFTWTKPTNFSPSVIKVVMWGAGGGGGGGGVAANATIHVGGAGGGGGAAAKGQGEGGERGGATREEEAVHGGIRRD